MPLVLPPECFNRRRIDAGGDFDEFLRDNPDLLSRDLLARWYSPDRIGSARARRAFLMPDLVA